METLIQDCKLSYRYQISEKNGTPTILLLHGWGCDGSIFDCFVNEWGKEASVLSVDFPGHGQSDEPPVPWGVPEYAEQVYSLIKQLHISGIYAVAHSFGGRVAIWLSSHHPGLIEKLVITGGAGIRKPEAQTQSKRQKQYKKLKAIVNFFAKFHFLQGFTGRIQEALIQKYGSADYKRLTSSMRQTFVKVISQDLSEYLPDVKASTLLVWGGNDTETPLWMGQKMEKEIPDAGLVVFDGRSHFAFLEERQRFQLIVNTFFFGGNV